MAEEGGGEQRINSVHSKYHTCGLSYFFYKGEVERGRKNKGREEGGRKGVGGEGDTIP